MEKHSLRTAHAVYYKSLQGELNDYNVFEDLDDLETLHTLDAKVRHHRSRNFVIDFGDDAAYCGFDLDATLVGRLLATTRPADLHTRWINIWIPHEQTDLITNLAEHFDFSPRLLGFMLSQPFERPVASRSTRHSTVSRFRRRHKHHDPASASDRSSVDIEGAVALTKLRSGFSSDSDVTRAFNQYSLAEEVWHWSAVDMGRRFLCLGFNSLYPCPGKEHSRASLNNGRGEESATWRDLDLPEGKRVWSWLLLCENKTVVTIHEDPFPHRNGYLDASELSSLLAIRRNLVNVFRNCSKACQGPQAPAVTRLPLRHRVGDSEEETAHRPMDVPGLLFFCLFDDWYSSYSIVFRREHRYAHELNELRTAMMRRAELSHVSRLHHIGRQLSVLKRMYQSYESLIEQVLTKQEATLASLKNSHVIAGINMGTENLEDRVVQVTDPDSLLGVPLSSAARARFERLRHRIRLYALNEIEECIAQKDALLMMNFNLIAILESTSVEQLTRITLLLAKVTILFMPVSLMSGYFSAQLSDVSFSSREYWQWFGIVFAASLTGLTVFSVVSGTFEGGTIYKSLGRRIAGWFRVGLTRETRSE